MTRVWGCGWGMDASLQHSEYERDREPFGARQDRIALLGPTAQALNTHARPAHAYAGAAGAAHRGHLTVNRWGLGPVVICPPSPSGIASSLRIFAIVLSASAKTAPVCA